MWVCRVLCKSLENGLRAEKCLYPNRRNCLTALGRNRHGNADWGKSMTTLLTILLLIAAYALYVHLALALFGLNPREDD